jgi:hypothetical protein
VKGRRTVPDSTSTGRGGAPASRQVGPIFIGGLSHSGKTPLGTALSAHPRIVITRKTYLWTRYFNRFGDLGMPANLDRCLAALMVDRDVASLRPVWEDVREALGEGPPTYGRLFGALHQHHAERLGKPRWGDQLGLVEQFAPAIFDSFPTARFVHMVRDPRNRGVGGRRGKLGWEMARWLHSAGLAAEHRRRYRGRYMVLCYEDLVEAPVPTLGLVMDFLDEEVGPEMLDALQRSLGDSGSDGAKIIAARTAKAAANGFLEHHARAEFETLGYAPADTAHPLPSFRPFDRAGMAAWRLIHRGPLTKRAQP